MSNKATLVVGRRRHGSRVVRTAAALIALAGALVAVPGPAQAEPTWTETTGSVTNTWTNYTNAGGTHGPSIPSYTSVQISCRLTGFATANGNTNWYRIASSPWNDAYYSSADPFYNDGATSGGLHGTPYVDTAVPVCGSAPPPPAPTPSVSLGQGPSTRGGYRYAVTLSNFAANSAVAVQCYDSVSPSGFYPFTMHTDGSGNASTASECYSGDGPDHWVVAEGHESNHVSWSGGSGSSGQSSSESSTGGSSSGGSGSGTGSGSSESGSRPGSGSASGNSGPAAMPVTHGSGDPCASRFQAGTQKSHSIFGGQETDNDKTLSQYLVCEGFGLPDGVSPSPGLACTTIALLAAVTVTGVSIRDSDVCDQLGYAYDTVSHHWVDLAHDVVCSVVADAAADGAAAAAVAATSETGPAAVAVGVSTWKGVQAIVGVVCGGAFAQARHLGHYLEARHESQVRADIITKGECLNYRRVFGYISWSAAAC